MSDAAFQFRPPYQLSGEPGKALGVLREGFADLGVISARLELRSMAADTLRITCGGSAAPEWMEEVSLWDADGRRVFTGLVTDLDEQWDGKRTQTIATVSGPWWWLDQVQLTSIIADDLGSEQERAIYTFPSQDLAVSLRAMLARLAEMGVPIRAGEIDPTFQVPQMQFQNGTAESILTTMLQLIPDAATSVRYDAGGTPLLDVRRRPTAPTVTIDLAADDNRGGIPRLTEQRSLVPTQVKIQTMQVDATGQIIYGEDVAGDPEPSSPLGRQIISLSGPGRSDFNTYTPRVTTLRTITIDGSHYPIWELASSLDPVIVAAVNQFGGITWASFGSTGNNGVPLGFTGVGSHRLVEGNYVDFLNTEFGITRARTRISGWVCGQYPSTGWTGATNHLRERFLCYSGFSGGTYNLAIFVDFEVDTISSAYASLTVMVHPEDQALVTRVPDLAANLLAAQKHIPVSGSIPLNPGAILPLPGNRINIRGGLPKWSSMGAMSAGLFIDLRTGAAECQVGRSSRTAVSSLLNQFSRPLSGKIIKA